MCVCVCVCDGEKSYILGQVSYLIALSIIILYRLCNRGVFVVQRERECAFVCVSVCDVYGHAHMKRTRTKPPSY